MSRLEGVGLTLSGGGISGSGAIWGFASALDLFLLSHEVTGFSSYTGVSAGACIASLLASGVSPHDVISWHCGRRPSPYIPLRPRDIGLPNWGEWARVPLRIGQALGRAVVRLLRGRTAGRGPRSMGVLPSGLFRNDGIAAFLRANLERAGCDDFRTLPCRLRVIFYDLLQNERVVCGSGPDEVADIPIHEAATASAAIPGIYTPRRIRAGGRTMLGVDGGVGGVTIAADGADASDVLIAYNDADYSVQADVEHTSAVAVLSLSLRLLFNQRNTAELARFIDSHPGHHVLVFQSSPLESAGLTSPGPLSYGDALRAFKASFERTRDRLAREIDYLALVFEGRGARVNPEIAKVRFEEVVEKGRAVKADLRRRHGIAPGAEAIPAAAAEQAA